MSANNYAPPVTITVNDTGGTITLKGLTYARFTPSPTIYDQISQATTAIACNYHKPLIAIAHSPAGRHTLIYTPEGEIREADEATLKDAQIDPSHYPPAASRETLPPNAYTTDEALSAPCPHLPLDTSMEANQSAQSSQLRHVKGKIAIGAAVVVVLIGMTGATYSLLEPNTSSSTHKGQSVGTVDQFPQSAYTQLANSSQSDALQSTKPQSPNPPQEQAAPPPSPNPAPKPDYGITDLQTAVLPGGGNGIVHVTFYLSGHGDTTATINIAGHSATVTGTAPGSVGAIVTDVPAGTHAWTATADGLVNSGTITVY